MMIDVLAKNISEILNKSCEATGVDAVFSFARIRKDRIPLVGEYDDMLAVGIAGSLVEQFDAIPEFGKFSIRLAARKAMDDLYLKACDEIGIQVPENDDRIARYLLQSYTNACGTSVEVRLRFRSMRDFLRCGCILLLGIKDNVIHVWLAWKKYGKFHSDAVLRGIYGKRMYIMPLTEIPATDDAFVLSHFRIVSLLLEKCPERIEEYFSWILRNEMARELSSMVCVIDEQGSGDPELRWHGGIIGVGYHAFPHLPFVPKDAARFATFLGRVYKAFNSEKNFAARFGLPNEPSYAAVQICLSNNRSAYREVMESPARFTEFPMGMGCVIVSARVLKPYENPLTLPPAEGELFINNGYLGASWRSNDIGKTVIRLTAGILPFYPCKNGNTYFVPPTPHPSCIFNHALSSILQFGKYTDIVIPDEYGADTALNATDAAWLDTMKERISNFGYSYLCGRPFNGENAFGNMLDRLEKHKENMSCLKKSA